MNVRRAIFNRVVWCALATIAFALLTDVHALSRRLGDTDDAVRLVSVRDLLHGASWFDTTLPRIGAPQPLVSHWSRLVDLPIAGLILALRPLLGGATAERWAVAIAPMLPYLLLLCSLALVPTAAFGRRVLPGGGRPADEPDDG